MSQSYHFYLPLRNYEKVHIAYGSITCGYSTSTKTH